MAHCPTKQQAGASVANTIQTPCAWLIRFQVETTSTLVKRPFMGNGPSNGAQTVSRSWRNVGTPYGIHLQRLWQRCPVKKRAQHVSCP